MGTVQQHAASAAHTVVKPEPGTEQSLQQHQSHSGSQIQQYASDLSSRSDGKPASNQADLQQHRPWDQSVGEDKDSGREQLRRVFGSPDDEPRPDNVDRQVAAAERGPAAVAGWDEAAACNIAVIRQLIRHYRVRLPKGAQAWVQDNLDKPWQATIAVEGEPEGGPFQVRISCEGDPAAAKASYGLHFFGKQLKAAFGLFAKRLVRVQPWVIRVEVEPLSTARAASPPCAPPAAAASGRGAAAAPALHAPGPPAAAVLASRHRRSKTEVCGDMECVTTQHIWDASCPAMAEVRSLRLSKTFVDLIKLQPHAQFINLRLKLVEAPQPADEPPAAAAAALEPQPGGSAHRFVEAGEVLLGFSGKEKWELRELDGRLDAYRGRRVRRLRWLPPRTLEMELPAARGELGRGPGGDGGGPRGAEGPGRLLRSGGAARGHSWEPMPVSAGNSSGSSSDGSSSSSEEEDEEDGAGGGGRSAVASERPARAGSATEGTAARPGETVGGAAAAGAGLVGTRGVPGNSGGATGNSGGSSPARPAPRAVPAAAASTAAAAAAALDVKVEPVAVAFALWPHPPQPLPPSSAPRLPFLPPAGLLPVRVPMGASLLKLPAQLLGPLAAPAAAAGAKGVPVFVSASVDGQDAVALGPRGVEACLVEPRGGGRRAPEAGLALARTLTLTSRLLFERLLRYCGGASIISIDAARDGGGPLGRRPLVRLWIQGAPVAAPWQRLPEPPPRPPEGLQPPLAGGWVNGEAGVGPVGGSVQVKQEPGFTNSSLRLAGWLGRETHPGHGRPSPGAAPESPPTAPASPALAAAGARAGRGFVEAGRLGTGDGADLPGHRQDAEAVRERQGQAAEGKWQRVGGPAHHERERSKRQKGAGQDEEAGLMGQAGQQRQGHQRQHKKQQQQQGREQQQQKLQVNLVMAAGAPGAACISVPDEVPQGDVEGMYSAVMGLVRSLPPEGVALLDPEYPSLLRQVADQAARDQAAGRGSQAEALTGLYEKHVRAGCRKAAELVDRQQLLRRVAAHLNGFLFLAQDS